MNGVGVFILLIPFSRFLLRQLCLRSYATQT
jgi:hypothetical protein